MRPHAIWRRMAFRDSPYLYVLPSVLVSGVLFGIPVIEAIYLSLTDASLRGQPARFVGFTNYLSLPTAPRVLRAALNTDFIAISGAAAQVLLGLGCALMLDELRRGAQALLTLIM